MDFGDASKYLKSGSKIRRDSWDKYTQNISYIFLARDTIYKKLSSVIEQIYFIHHDDVLANDWNIVVNV